MWLGDGLENSIGLDKGLESSGSESLFLALFNISMLTTFISSFVVALWLFKRAPQFRVLALYCVGMGSWSIGLWLIQNPWWPSGTELGRILVNLQPLLPCLFLHFCLRFLATHQARSHFTVRFQHSLIYGLYACAGLFMALSFWFDQGQIAPWLMFSQFYHLNTTASLGLLFAIVVGFFALLLLILAYFNVQQFTHHEDGNESFKAQLMTLFISAGWGFLLASAYVFASLALNVAPYSLILLPSYIVFLVFGIIRYHLFEVNAFAERIAAWTLILAGCLIVLGLLSTMAGQAGFTPFNEVPWQWLWAYSALLLLMSALLFNPMRRFANRIIYPNSQVNQSVLAQWQTELNLCESFEQLQGLAQSLLVKHCGTEVRVEFSRPKDSDDLAIYCFEDSPSIYWTTQLNNWQNASPSVRHVAEVFANVLAQQAQTLARSFELAQLQQQQVLEQAKQQHLAEVGTMTAAIAHELRNPLNIIAMANVQNSPEIESIIKDQLVRANHLITEVLDYTRDLSLNLQSVNLLAVVNAGIQKIIPLSKIDVRYSIEVDSTIEVEIDGFRFNQVLDNILQNAIKALVHQPDPEIIVCSSIQHDHIHLLMSNNGPNIDSDIKETLFQPFVTRSQGGTGLGLAICKRIIEAHGGSIHLTDSRCNNHHTGCTFEIILAKKIEKKGNKNG